MKNLIILIGICAGLGACSNDTPRPNRAPSIANIADQSIVANETADPILVAVSDDSTAALNLVFAASSDNDSLLPPAAVLINPTTTGSELIITPSAGMIGTAAITLTATDTSGASDSVSFVVTVNRQPVSYAQFLRNVFLDTSRDLPRDINSVELTGSEVDEDFSDLL